MLKTSGKLYFKGSNYRNFIGLHPSRFFLRSSRIEVDLLSHDSKTADIREQCVWMGEKNWTGKTLQELRHLIFFSPQPNNWILLI